MPWTCRSATRSVRTRWSDFKVWTDEIGAEPLAERLTASGRSARFSRASAVTSAEMRPSMSSRPGPEVVFSSSAARRNASRRNRRAVARVELRIGLVFFHAGETFRMGASRLAAPARKSGVPTRLS